MDKTALSLDVLSVIIQGDMHPNQPTPEQAPRQPNLEGVPDDNRQEVAPLSPERKSASGNQSAQGDSSYASLPLPQAPQPAPQPVNNTANADSSPGPAIADDVDLIEKEWVDKAKSIVNEHKHDPHTQEKEVGRLQADYLQKRYGKTLKREQ